MHTPLVVSALRPVAAAAATAEGAGTAEDRQDFAGGGMGMDNSGPVL